LSHLARARVQVWNTTAVVAPSNTSPRMMLISVSNTPGPHAVKNLADYFLKELKDFLL
jgi:hypothetical protein